jgi:hypothetical protein
MNTLPCGAHQLKQSLRGMLVLLWLGTAVTALSLDGYSPELEANAKGGNAESQYQLSRCYLLGKGVAENDAMAVKWEMQAAERNHAEAQFFLGTRYSLGYGVTKDMVQAGKWLALAAKAGHIKARKMFPGIEKSLSADQEAQVMKLLTEFRPLASAKPTVKIPLPPGMERASNYELLIGEGGAGSGFIVRYYQSLCAVTSLHQFEGATPKRLENSRQQPVLLNPGKVIKQKDVQAVLLADQKATVPCLDYNPKFQLVDHEPVCLFDAAGKPHEAELYFLTMASEYLSMEGPKEMNAKLKFPIKAAGASGSPIIQQSTGLVIGVLLGADSPSQATVISFETLCLPDLSPKPAPKPAPVYTDAKQADAYRDFTEFAKRVPTIHWKASEKYLRAWKVPSVDTLEEFVQSNQVSEMEVQPAAEGKWEASLKMGNEKVPSLFWKYQFISDDTKGWTFKAGQKVDHGKPMEISSDSLMKRSFTSAFAADAAKK